jgi:soluble cytochrome b562
MKLRSTLLCSLLAVAGASTALLAQAPAVPAPAPAGAAAPAHEEKKTELGEKMSAFAKAFKALRLQVTDATKNESSLKLVATMRENAEAAAKLEPAKKVEVPAADQAKFEADYAEQMKNFIADIAKLEDALKTGNNEEAKKLTDTLNDDQKKGHKEFRKKKPENKPAAPAAK